MPVPRVYSVIEASEAIKVCSKSIYRMIDAGTIRAVRTSKRGKILIPESAINEFLGGERQRS